MNTQSIPALLKANPGIAVESKDDAKCKALFLQLGMLEAFTRSTTPNLCAVTFPKHPMAWGTIP